MTRNATGPDAERPPATNRGDAHEISSTNRRSGDKRSPDAAPGRRTLSTSPEIAAGQLRAELGAVIAWRWARAVLDALGGGR
jgi:hypothetical protein